MIDFVLSITLIIISSFLLIYILALALALVFENLFLLGFIFCHYTYALHSYLFLSLSLILSFIPIH